MKIIYELDTVYHLYHITYAPCLFSVSITDGHMMLFPYEHSVFRLLYRHEHIYMYPTTLLKYIQNQNPYDCTWNVTKHFA